MISIYQLKPKFQNLLRPFVQWLAHRGVTANRVTLLALIVSLLLGIGLFCWGETRPVLFLLLPIWMFIRMAFNAIDGMLAREFAQQSPLGAYLNELSDVIADAALYLPFALITPFNAWSIGAVIWLAALSEMAGALGPMVGAPRAYDGPMGKSDRAFVFGAIGLYFALAAQLPHWLSWLPWLMCIAMGVNIVKRINSGVGAATKKT